MSAAGTATISVSLVTHMGTVVWLVATNAVYVGIFTSVHWCNEDAHNDDHHKGALHIVFHT